MKLCCHIGQVIIRDMKPLGKRPVYRDSALSSHAHIIAIPIVHDESAVIMGIAKGRPRNIKLLIHTHKGEMITGISSVLFLLPVKDAVFTELRHSLPVPVVDIGTACIRDNRTVGIILLNLIFDIFRIILGNSGFYLCGRIRLIDQIVSGLCGACPLIVQIGIGIEMPDISKCPFMQIIAAAHHAALR